MRIALAGFQHETNTFAPSKADFAAFEMADSWPPLLTGDQVISATRGLNLPIAGAAEAAEGTLVPLVWCAAEPSGLVTQNAFDRIAEMILDGLRNPIDALFLDLHGAMVTERFDDGEGELLRRIRERFDGPIAVSLDLHANVSRQMVELADILTIYRTYPHLDMAETGARAVQALGALPAHKAFRQAPFLVPLHAQYTGAEPCRSLYRMLDEICDQPGDRAELAMGFTAADIAECGPSVVTYGASAARAEALADQVLAALEAAEHQFDTRLYAPDEALRIAREAPKPVVLADVQDNPGAGGEANTTGLLEAVLAAAPASAVLGVFAEPKLAARAHSLGQGASFEGRLGSLEACFKVERLSPGEIPYSGEMYGGGIAVLGPSCLLSIEGVQVVVSSQRVQCLDQALFTHFGVRLAEMAVIGVKSTAHFRADFEPLGGTILCVASPGAFACRLDEIEYHRLRPGVRRIG